MLEDLADRQLGQQPHGQDHPANDFVRQCAASRIRLAGDLKGLANGLGRDNLFESRQTIQDPARVVGRERAMSLWHASRSLLVAGVVNKPKLTGGCDLPYFNGIDLKALKERFPDDLGGCEIQEFEGTDYAYRLFVDKPVWSQVLAGLAEETDYDNFKSEVARHQGRAGAAYEHSLHEVWSVMNRLQK